MSTNYLMSDDISVECMDGFFKDKAFRISKGIKKVTIGSNAIEATYEVREHILLREDGGYKRKLALYEIKS